tara:strand:- start:700 stop:1113 length:414 start_codon:yes stop_codon:yes gene_type:complete
MALTDASDKNKSGKFGEKRIREFLKENNFAFKEGGNKGIDFQITTKDGMLYVDSKNQNAEGSVEKGIVQTVMQYRRWYTYKEVYIVRGEALLGEEVLISLKELEQALGFKTHIITFEEFKNFMNKQTQYSPLEQFFK